jgi:hypothetical protein
MIAMQVAKLPVRGHMFFPAEEETEASEEESEDEESGYLAACCFDPACFASRGHGLVR